MGGGQGRRPAVSGPCLPAAVTFPSFDRFPSRLRHKGPARSPPAFQTGPSLETER